MIDHAAGLRPCTASWRTGAKLAQEDILKAGPVPYSIVRATQFFEFVDAMLSWTADGNTVRLPATPVQPIASADAAQAVTWRTVVTDDSAGMFAAIPGDVLIAEDGAVIAGTAYRDWLAR